MNDLSPKTWGILVLVPWVIKHGWQDVPGRVVGTGQESPRNHQADFSVVPGECSGEGCCCGPGNTHSRWGWIYHWVKGIWGTTTNCSTRTFINPQYAIQIANSRGNQYSVSDVENWNPPTTSVPGEDHCEAFVRNFSDAFVKMSDPELKFSNEATKLPKLTRLNNNESWDHEEIRE